MKKYRVRRAGSMRGKTSYVRTNAVGLMIYTRQPDEAKQFDTKEDAEQYLNAFAEYAGIEPSRLKVETIK